MEKISVVIPVYNSQKYLEKCLGSVVNQTYNNFEVILIDDGSTDSSFEFCQSIINANHNKNIKLIHQQNGGVSSARNAGIDNSTGEYIVFIDSDDEVDSDMLEYLYSLINSNSECDLGVCGYYKDRPSLNDSITAKTKSTNMSGSPSIYPSSEQAILYLSRLNAAKAVAGIKHALSGFLWNKIFKKSIIVKNNIRFNEKYHVCEDVLFCHKYINNCRLIAYSRTPKYHYFTRENSAVRTLSEKRLSVIDAYNEIIEFLKIYNDNELNCKLQSNYVLHNVQLIKIILLNKDIKWRNQCRKAYSSLKYAIKYFLRDSHVSSKYKAYAIILYLLFPLIERIVFMNLINTSKAVSQRNL